MDQAVIANLKAYYLQRAFRQLIENNEDKQLIVNEDKQLIVNKINNPFDSFGWNKI